MQKKNQGNWKIVTETEGEKNYILRRDLEPAKRCLFVGQSRRWYALTRIINRKNQMLVLNNNGNEEKQFDDKDERMNTNPRLRIRPMVGGYHSLEATLLLIRVATMTLSFTHSTTLKPLFYLFIYKSNRHLF